MLIQHRSGKTWIGPGRFWCLPEVISPPNGMQSKQTGNVSGIGHGCQLPWVAGLELATVNKGGWIINHGKRPSLGEEEVGKNRLLTQRLNRSPVKHLDKNLCHLCSQAIAPHCKMSMRGSVQITYTWTITKGKCFFFFLWSRCVKHIMQITAAQPQTRDFLFG